ncbi:sulfate ABC transporter substrate-binding protein [Anaerosporobacter sp.]|uniref:sulfate ABC transporter substrate-binding protein n=1 Tax=Anaerosporobacter sp. TaxID=1872529 RepID=UPI00286EBEF0|nr:sulfate ABC transporter substrate-binding protein [Anaerosporobacter sp.]
MKKNIKKLVALNLVLLLAVGSLTGCKKNNSSASGSGSIEITNVSYDPTREFYEAYNVEFAKYWKDKTGQTVTVTQSHGGSGKQARSVIEGNEADVVTLALAHDITSIEEAGLIEKGWIEEFDKNSSPYTSTIVFLVRKGNEKSIQDWSDLIKDGVNVITPNPKTSGGACWNFLSAWAYADAQYNGDETQIKDFVTKLYKNVSVLDSGARGATTTFVENGQGDVLIAWENEAYLTLKEHPEEYEIVTPSISILAEPSVAIVDSVAKKRGTEEVAKEYLEYLYSDVGQRLAGENYYRPSNQDILNEFADVFNLSINMVNIDDFGGWDKAYEVYFQDGGVFDQIYTQ